MEDKKKAPKIYFGDDEELIRSAEKLNELIGLNLSYIDLIKLSFRHLLSAFEKDNDFKSVIAKDLLKKPEIKDL